MRVKFPNRYKTWFLLHRAARVRGNRRICFVIDVDGVLTNGKFIYSASGKEFKIFGPEDKDGLSILEKYGQINIISADARGLDISRRRALDMSQNIEFVDSGARRAEYLRKLKESGFYVVFVADSITDIKAAKVADLVFSPANSSRHLSKISDINLCVNGGEGVLMEVADHILRFFFRKNVLDEF